MEVITLAGRKGGIGKTTISVHLAVCGARSGASVLLIDTDPQGSAAQWWNAREKDDVHYLSVSPADLKATLAEIEGIDYVIIDTPPIVNDSISALVRESGLVLIPCRPSQLDINSIGATVDLVAAEGTKMAFVCNGAAHRARLATETVALLSEHGPVSPSTLHQRTEFARSMANGSTVLDDNPDGLSAAEVEKLWSFVTRQLKKKGARRG